MKDKIINYYKENILGEKTKEVDKDKTLLILFGWILFIVLVTLIVVSGNARSNNNEANNELKFMPIEELFDKYKEYDYTVKIKEYNFIGHVSKESNQGTVTIGEKTINYEILNNNLFNIDEGNYLDMNFIYNYFDLNSIYEKIITGELRSERVEDNNKIYLYNCLHNSEDMTFKITTTVDNIKEITYTYDSIEYKLNLK